MCDGAPTAVQLFTGNLKDEECLQIGAVVDLVLNGS